MPPYKENNLDEDSNSSSSSSYEFSNYDEEDLSNSHADADNISKSTASSDNENFIEPPSSVGEDVEYFVTLEGGRLIIPPPPPRYASLITTSSINSSQSLPGYNLHRIGQENSVSKRLRETKAESRPGTPMPSDEEAPFRFNHRYSS